MLTANRIRHKNGGHAATWRHTHDQIAEGGNQRLALQLRTRTRACRQTKAALQIRERIAAVRQNQDTSLGMGNNEINGVRMRGMRPGATD